MLPTKTLAPELTAAAGWINSTPLTLEQLRGKVVLLDFWTFCCVDCLHMLPYLKHLEEQFPEELVVIGVHSAKFTNEKDSAQIRQAVERYGIRHPVANDAKFALWEAYWIREWPTLVLIDPDGFIVERVACSQKPYGKFAEPIRQLIAEFDALGKLNRQPLSQLQPSQQWNTGLLRYPGKVIAEGDRLFVADTGNNRILALNSAGETMFIVGDGQPGWMDGTYTEAQFNGPQGLAFHNGKLYVADTENHRIRQVDLQAGMVKTVAGTGIQALFSESPPSMGEEAALQCDLSSPWDLVGHDWELFICMAGSHQIWALDPAKGTIRLHAGSGRESLVDGRLNQSQFAQPSGISCDGRSLFVVDAETSSVRRVAVDQRGVTETIVGTGLFDFGDRDGERSQVLLQHPLGIVQNDGQLFICDTYNHKIKRVDQQSGATATVAGGRAGFEDGASPRFAEPSGLCIFGKQLVVADTNNHALRLVDITTGHTSTLVGPSTQKTSNDSSVGSGGRKPAPANTPEAPEVWPNLVEITGSPTTVACNSPGTLLLQLQFPAGVHLNADAPLTASVLLDGSPLPTSARRVPQGVELSVHWPNSPSARELLVRAQFIYCADSEGAACHIASRGWRLPITLAEDEKNSAVNLFAAM